MPSFQSFSSGGQSSNMKTPETTPLRKRENDSFASPEAPLLWRHPLQPATGGLNSATTYSPSMAPGSSRFGEMNFAHPSRRRGRYDNRHGAQFWIPWIMKAILASPVVVLLIWFSFVALHHPTSSSMKSNRYGTTARSPRLLQQHQQPNVMQKAAAQKNKGAHHDQHNILPVYVPMGSSNQQQFQQYLSQSGGTQDVPQLLLPQMQEMAQKAPYQNAQGQQMGFMRQVQPEMQMQQPALNMMAGQNMMQLTQQQPGHMYQQQQPMQVMPSQAQMYQQAQPQMMMNQAPLQMQLVDQNHYDDERQPLFWMMPRGNHKLNQKPAHPSKVGKLRGGRKASTMKESMGESQEQQVIYYYDPAQASVQGGQYQLPSVVYDQHGNGVQLESLASTGDEILVQPPMSEYMTAPFFGSPQSYSGGNNRNLVSSSNNTETPSNSTSPYSSLQVPPILPPPPLEMKISTPESWGESTSQDQSIIVCTVAVMALLVGALSARRLRAKSFLSSCIENESLEDEVKYDNAFTISGADSYNTFGWKGDLEKFDV